MSISLNTLRPAKGAKTSKKRVGRGLARKGTTAGKGQKGQSARSGVGGLKRLGMRSLMLATPKVRGFKSLASKPEIVNLSSIAAKFIAGEVVSPKTLLAKGLISRKGVGVKILGEGDIAIAVSVKGCTASASASEKITKAGGTLIA